LRNIGAFIKAGGYFPNNLLINFTRAVRFDKISCDETADITYGQLYLPDRYRSAWIIDGQHRLYGFSPIKDVFLDQNIIVVAFENLPTAEEADLFVTINHEQKSVPKHLLDDLEGELKWGSDVPSERVGAIASRLINCLNADVGEPFYNRITQQGISSTNKTCLTIPALKDALRRSGLLGRSLLNNASYELGPLCGRTDIETLDRSRSALNQYFSLVRNANLTQWENGRAGFLCTNVAVQAYIILLGEVIKYWEVNTASDSRQMNVEDIICEIEEYLSPVVEFLKHADDAGMMTAFHVPFGSGGPPQYNYRLCSLIKGAYSDFEPEGMRKWETEQSEDKIKTADQQIHDLIVHIGKYIFTVFRQMYGEDRGAYWDKGVPDNSIKAEAYKLSLDDEIEVRLPLEDYLYVIDLKRIVEHKQNWPLFKAVFNIPEPGEKGRAKNLKWMECINELRRISAHPSETRHYKVEDFEYIEFIYTEFFRRLQEAQQNPAPQAVDLAEDADA
jgi:DGQHR domain-containing protein